MFTQKSRLVIVGVIRNGEKCLEQSVGVIDKAFEDFDRKWLIVESDSEDSSRLILTNLSKRYNIDVLCLGDLRFNIHLRTERLAMCRNTYLDRIMNCERYIDREYVVVADLDGVNDGLTKSAIQVLSNERVSWDACFANQNAAYYDIWALRHEFLSPNDWLGQYKFFRAIGKSRYFSRKVSLYSRMIRIPLDAVPIRVTSAFGGLGVYKRDVLLSARYRGTDEQGHEICEHVPLNATLSRNGANLLIIPSLINGSWNEHNFLMKKSLYLYRLCRDYVIDTILGK